MATQPKRIYIVGSSGSGKTTLAKSLAEQLKYPHIDLDDVRYPADGQKRTLEERDQIIQDLVRQPNWIAEGVYVSWTKPLLEAADQIIWLDLPLGVTLPRILKRSFFERLAGQSRYSLKSNLKLIRFLIRHHYPNPRFADSEEDKHITRDKIQKALEPYSTKVAIITT